MSQLDLSRYGWMHVTVDTAAVLGADTVQPTPISISFASDLIGDIAALEPQDIIQFTAAFDNFELAELEQYRHNVREIAKRILAYKRSMQAATKAARRTLIATPEYKASRVARRREQRAEKRKLAKLLEAGDNNG